MILLIFSFEMLKKRSTRTGKEKDGSILAQVNRGIIRNHCLSFRAVNCQMVRNEPRRQLVQILGKS